MDRPYTLRFLPLFEHDLNSAVDYIAYALKNPDAAMKLIDDVEAAIYRRVLYSGRDWRRKIE